MNKKGYITNTLTEFKFRSNGFYNTKKFILIALLSIFTTIIVWLPFLLKIGEPTSRQVRFGFESIYRNYDGLMFVIPAKTNYRSDQIEKYKVLDLKPSYYAAHTPGYPVLIKLLAPLFGFLESMLFINLLGSVLMGCLLYLFYIKFFAAKNPLLLTVVTLLLPRIWILRSTGSSEIVFMCCLLASALLLSNKKYLWAALFAVYASFTRIHGVLWGLGLIAYFVYNFVVKKQKSYDILVVGLSGILGFVGVCLLYLRQYGDFMAYFHTAAVVPSGFFYSQFDSNAKEVKTFFLEDLLVYFAAVWIYIFDRFNKSKDFLFFFVIVYFAFILTIQHRDLARYLVPVMPVLIGASHELFQKKAVKWALIALLPAIYLYVINFIGSNMFLDSMLPFM